MSKLETDFSKFCINCIEHKPFSIEEINVKRTSIEVEVEKMTKRPVNVDNFNTILTQPVLKKIVDLYDSKFFYGKLLENLNKNGCVLKVCFDNRCTRTAGICSYDRCKNITVKLSTKVFQKALKSGSVKINSGLECSKFLTCLLITFEHELIHGLVFCLCGIYRDSKILERENPSLKLFKGEFHDKSGHGKLFMTIVNNKFGHTKYKHNLFSHKPNPDAEGNRYKLLSERMTIPQIRKSLKLGDKVLIFSNGEVKEGEIYKIFTKFIYWKNGDERWKTAIARIIDTSKTPSNTPSLSPSPEKTPSPPKPKKGTKKIQDTLLKNLQVGNEVIMNARLPGKEDLYTLLVKITEINRRKKTKQIRVLVLEGEFKAKYFLINPGLIVTKPDNPLLPASPKTGKEKSFKYGTFDSLPLARKPSNFTDDMNSVDVNEITPKLLEKINSLPRYNWPEDKNPYNYFPDGKKIGGGKTGEHFIVKTSSGDLVLGQTSGFNYMRYGIKLEGKEVRTLLKDGEIEYKDIWKEDKKSTPKSNSLSPSPPKPKTPPPKKKTIKKTKKVVWDGPHQDKFIPGVAKEYKGKRISTLEEAKRVSIELGDKSTGFTKKKFYSIRNGKTLRKAVGEVSWMKKN
jgi:hypothetical protein